MRRPDTLDKVAIRGWERLDPVERLAIEANIRQATARVVALCSLVAFLAGVLCGVVIR